MEENRTHLRFYFYFLKPTTIRGFLCKNLISMISFFTIWAFLPLFSTNRFCLSFHFHFCDIFWSVGLIFASWISTYLFSNHQGAGFPLHFLWRWFVCRFLHRIQTSLFGPFSFISDFNIWGWWSLGFHFLFFLNLFAIFSNLTWIEPEALVPLSVLLELSTSLRENHFLNCLVRAVSPPRREH